MRIGRGIVLGLAMAVAAQVSNAQAAAPLAVRLDFVADERCPNQEAFWQKLASRTAIRQSDARDALRLKIVLSASSTEARGDLLAGNAPLTHAREVRAATCDEVANALALIAALIVERTKRLEVPAPPAVPAPLPIPAAPIQPVARPSQPALVALGAQAIATRPMASAPLTGGGISLFVDRQPTWWLSANYAKNDLLFAANRARVDFGVVTLGVGPPSLRLGAMLRVAAALAGQAAFLAAEGVKVDVPSSARRSYWAAGVLGRLHWAAVERGFLFLEVGGFVPFVARRFSTREPLQRADTTAKIALQAAGGFALGL